MKLPLSFLLPKIDGIPVLLYHRVGNETPGKLSITKEQLREQFIFLRKRGYCCLSLTEFLDALAGKIGVPPKSVLLTFNDGYHSHYSMVYPLLKEFSLKAVFFIAGNLLDDAGNDEPEPAFKKMNLSELKELDPSIVRIALQGYDHIPFRNSGLDEIKNDILKSIAVFKDRGIPFHRVLSYPYGERPGNSDQLLELKKWMKRHAVRAAFRIGNKPSKIPMRDRYEIKRITISGTDSLKDFSVKLKKGKLKPF